MASLAARIAYFSEAIFREYAPGAGRWAAWQTRRQMPMCSDDLPEAIRQRVDYCNQLDDIPRPPPSRRLGDLSFRQMRTKKLYWIDLYRHAQGFGPDFRLDFVFGDVTEVPPRPSFVKSRPISGDRRNAVLLPLDRLRHFHFPKDRLSWAEKRPAAVWRGRINNQAPRHTAVLRYGADSRHEIGHVCNTPGLPPPKDWMSIAAQLRYRYVISLEGHDVATNLKWIMASNSIALSPALAYETWFMEGRLVPGEHFVEIAPDFSDLDEKIAWCEAHPEATRRIVRNAQAWVRQFRNPATERLTARLVLQKYRERMNHLPSGKRLFDEGDRAGG